MRLIIESGQARRANWTAVPGTAPQAGGAWLTLDAGVERQQKRNWCWAAIATGLARYYQVLTASGSAWTQAGLVAATQAWSDDGDRPAEADTIPDAENLPDSEALLPDILTRIGCLSHWSAGRPSIERITDEIAAARPLCLRIAWPDGRNHYVLLAGCVPGGTEIAIEDPLDGPSIHNFREFPGHYRGRTGVWAETIWTCPPPARRPGP